MKVISDNAVNRATLQTSTPTVAGLGVANLKTDVKTKVCRASFATGTLDITVEWASPERIDGVVLAFTNCRSSTTLRVVAYAQPADTEPLYDVTKLAVKANYGNHYSTTTNNNIATTGGFYASHWLSSPVVARKVVVTITDPFGGYVQAGRLIIGTCWEPTVSAEQQGTSMTMVDMSQHFRTESGDMYVNVKPQYRKQTLSMSTLDVLDRAKMWKILWRNGMVQPLYISLFPDNEDGELEQVHQIFGRLAASPVMETPYWNHMSATIEIEEV